MNILKKLYSSLLLTAVAGLIPSGLMAYDACCFNNIKIGADFLYWQACRSDLDYAVHDKTSDFELENDHLHTKYIDPEWDPGFRVWVGMDDIFCGFNGAVVYTYFDTNTTEKARGDLLLSTSIPTPENHRGNRVKAKWDLEYQTLDLLLSYPLQISCDRNLAFEAFSGITWLSINEKRHDHLHAEDDRHQSFHRDLDVWGLGPVMGVKSSYDWSCFKLFGLASTTLLVGEAEAKDHIRNTIGTDRNNRFKNCDECVCFPGFHFVSGIAYDLCLCDMQLGLHLGWEYVHWINAPSFPYYEATERGVRSASSEKSLTMQGLFSGVNLTF